MALRKVGTGKATGRACRLKQEQNGGLCDEQDGASNQNASVSVCLCVCLCVCERKRKGGTKKERDRERERERERSRGRERKQESKHTYMNLKTCKKQQGHGYLILRTSISLN